MSVVAVSMWRTLGGPHWLTMKLGAGRPWGMKVSGGINDLGGDGNTVWGGGVRINLGRGGVRNIKTNSDE